MISEDRRDNSTRDTAVRAETMINQHMTDCSLFRVAIQNTLAEFRQDLKSLNWRMAMIVGGITVAGEAVRLAFGK